MARSANIYTGDGSTTQFAVNFTLGFISRSDVVAYVEDEVDGGGDQIYRTITWINDGLVELSPAPADTKKVFIRRVMDKTALQHDFQDGAIMNEESFDESNLQLLYIMHEILDGFYNVDDTDVSDTTLAIRADMDMQSTFLIKNVLDPTDAQHAATKQYVDDVIGSNAVALAAASAAAAAVSEANAAGSESAAAASAIVAGDAETAAVAAKVAAEAAQAAAEAAEDGAVAAVTFENLNAAGDVGTGSTQVAQGDHTHASATDAAPGFVELSDTAENQAGTAIDRVPTVAGVREIIGEFTLSGVYVSSAQSIVAASLLTLPHGLGLEPKLVRFIIECIDAGGDQGYVQGDRIMVDFNNTGANNNRNTSPMIDATNVTIRMTNQTTAFSAQHPDTGAPVNLVNTKWELYVVAVA